ncbi:hypothetical protein MMC10_009422 [Thelotrema lepadinum]|nr:hypothetical protein [Thelotrema lepadinum]
MSTIPPTKPAAAIDRQQTTPFLLNLCYRQSSHHRLDEFPLPPTHALPRDRIQIYTWPSCTLRELSHLLTSALPSLLPTPVVGTRLSYRLVYPDAKESYLAAAAAGGGSRGGINGSGREERVGRYLSKELGSVVVGAEAESSADAMDVEKSRGEGEEKALETEGKVTVAAGGVMAGRLDGEPDKTLADARFVIGDFVSCAIYPPGANGEVAPAPTPIGAGRGPVGPRGGGAGGMYTGPRENGYGGGGGGLSGGPRGGGYGGRAPGGGGGGGGYRGGGGAGYGRLNDGSGGIPAGEWRRGERLPDGGYGGRGGFGRGRGRGW